MGDALVACGSCSLISSIHGGVAADDIASTVVIRWLESSWYSGDRIDTGTGKDAMPPKVADGADVRSSTG